jgi:hypothetical protein
MRAKTTRVRECREAREGPRAEGDGTFAVEMPGPFAHSTEVR